MNTMRHPSRHTEAELRNMLRDEQLALTRRVIVLEHEIRERVAELYAAEGRLAEINDASELLSNGSTNHRDGK
jgi:hypothetical protein